MFSYQDKASNGGDSYFDDSFYSSNSIDNSEHARNFRNSVVLPDMSRNASFDSGLRLQPTNIHEFEAPHDGTEYPSEFSDVDETETKTLKVTASPSLSALSGILSDKTRKVESRLRNSVILEQSIPEEESTPKIKVEPIVHDSPNLIDMGGSSNGNNFVSFKSEAGNGAFQEQPDFLMTPKLDPPTPRVEPAASGSSNGSQIQQNAISAAQTSETERDNKAVAKPTPAPPTAHTESAESAPLSRPISKKQASSIRSFSGMSAGSRSFVESSGKEQGENTKRKNIFSFLKRRPQKSASFVVKESSSEAPLPTSSTFSIPKTSKDDELPTSTRLTKKTHSNGSIFSAFRKNKSGKSNTAVPNLDVPKQRNQHRSSASFHDDVPVKRDVRSRKPTPLDFEHQPRNPGQSQETHSISAPEKQESQSVSTKDEVESNTVGKSQPEPSVQPTQSIAVSPTPETPAMNESASGKPDFGEVLFPKSLSAQEVESIVSLERSRSVKSNKRSSLNSHRISFTDNMSMKAQNGGMFITEPSAIKLSTPDLSKSPQTSILRNGTFDSLEFSPQKSSSRSQRPLEPESGSFNPEDKDFSFTSIEQTLNDLTVDSGSAGGANDEKRASVTSAAASYENEFMSDIMEFASIIDFGKDLDLSLDLNPPEKGYHSLNPADKSRLSEQRDDTVSIDSFNFDSGTPERSPEKSGSKLAPALDSAHRDSYQSDISMRKYLVSDHGAYSSDKEEGFDDEEFEGENFNQLEEPLTGDDEIAALWQSPTSQGGRPLSLSFKGLRAQQLNNPSPSSLMPPSSTSYTIADSFAAKTVAFSSNIILYATYTEEEYDRHPDIATCNQLTPQLAQMIKDELNSLKSEMEVHEESRCYTHFY
ncbi:LAME_0G07052g1_1 [Lachancea meyersii CBS 8951]|uniref:LAME_0G07052g1_1 n=1 Tax=Lachancea meyersii CBS 8951 TaxID=1266667 RepID=A0A1G4K7R4_9SACH|nr:LAME_0G07052g1_1 [Lachancea meyersii CBS 8951]